MLVSIQREPEISKLLDLVAYVGAKTGIEIGAASCGTSVLLSRAMGRGSLLVSVDLPVDSGGTTTESEDEARREIQANRGRFVLIRGRSSEPETVRSVVDSLGGRMVDLILIDAEHTQEAAARDFIAYSNLRSPHCVTAFHDICYWALWPMWNSLRGSVRPNRSIEIIDNVSQDSCGLGIILGNENIRLLPVL